MEDINVFLVSEQVIILFVVVIAGIYSRKMKIIDMHATNALSRFLLNVTQPLMIVTSFQIDFDPKKLTNGLTILLASVVVHITVAFLVIFIYKPFKKNREDRKIYEMCCIFNNCAFLGYPVMKVVFGNELGIFYGSFYATFFNIFIWTYGVQLLSKSGDEKEKEKKAKPSWASVMVRAKKIFLNAGFIASVLGLVIFIFQIRFPPILYSSAKLIGDMTFPLSMIIIGSLVSDLDFKSLFLSLKNYYYILIKLFALPIVGAVILCALKADTYLIYTVTIMLSMPTAANVAIFADTYNANAALAGRLVGLSTMVSIVSIPAMLFILEKIIAIFAG